MKIQALAGAVAAGLLTAGTGAASSAIANSAPAYVTAAVADPDRPAADTALDASRKPAEILTFIGIKPGDKVVDLFAGAYWDRLFSKVVGPSGTVIAFQSVEMAKALKQALPPVGSAPYPNYPNIIAQSKPINDLDPPPGSTDIVWMRQNYHDMYDPFMGPADVPAVDRAIFKSLKHGGVFIVIDHSAPDGSGLASTNTTHRIRRGSGEERPGCGRLRARGREQPLPQPRGYPRQAWLRKRRPIYTYVPQALKSAMMPMSRCLSSWSKHSSVIHAQRAGSKRSNAPSKASRLASMTFEEKPARNIRRVIAARMRSSGVAAISGEANGRVSASIRSNASGPPWRSTARR